MLYYYMWFEQKRLNIITKNNECIFFQCWILWNNRFVYVAHVQDKDLVIEGKSYWILFHWHKIIVITGHAKEMSMFKHLWILTLGAFQNVPISSHILLFDFWITEFSQSLPLGPFESFFFLPPSQKHKLFSAGRTFTVKIHGITMTFFDDSHH